MLRCALVKKEGWWWVEGKSGGGVGGTECCLVAELRWGVHSDSQGTQQLWLYAEKKKKSLLLSVCKGNENLMRLDSFFFSSIHSHSTLCSTTGSPRRGAPGGRNGEAFLHRVCWWIDRRMNGWWKRGRRGKKGCRVKRYDAVRAGEKEGKERLRNRGVMIVGREVKRRREKRARATSKSSVRSWVQGFFVVGL